VDISREDVNYPQKKAYFHFCSSSTKKWSILSLRPGTCKPSLRTKADGFVNCVNPISTEAKRQKLLLLATLTMSN